MVFKYMQCSLAAIDEMQCMQQRVCKWAAVACDEYRLKAKQSQFLHYFYHFIRWL